MTAPIIKNNRNNISYSGKNNGTAAAATVVAITILLVYDDSKDHDRSRIADNSSISSDDGTEATGASNIGKFI